MTRKAAESFRRAAAGHRIVIWDNYPVNDRSGALHLGPVIGRDAGPRRGRLRLHEQPARAAERDQPHPAADLRGLRFQSPGLRPGPLDRPGHRPSGRNARPKGRAQGPRRALSRGPHQRQHHDGLQLRPREDGRAAREARRAAACQAVRRPRRRRGRPARPGIPGPLRRDEEERWLLTSPGPKRCSRRNPPARSTEGRVP